MPRPGRPAATVEAVFFDVGETLVDETRLWGLWADWLGVPRLAFFAALGAVVERGEHHWRAFELVQPGFDLARARREREAEGWPPDVFAAGDLYPDALPCLAALRSRGYRVGVVGNQPARAEEVLLGLGAPLDAVASSERWGVEKPSPAFFSHVVEEAGLAPGRIAYVGDRLDNDVLPAVEAGLVGVFLRRGPWGFIHAGRPEAARAHLRLDGLTGLPNVLESL